ncbi:probable E3 ubiquitin-protein ligase ZFP1 isoform X4 [Triticum dicoccoides]|uniref:probable E3 ubiquitin-protein ligase ZFP1 isoform X4 n=1 Tax=Triticum dicoccoides TaxID=85692 RepID=UPI000E7A6351|nr:probable E3 ubiquitin-protein ligase ZFP1 isoform X4 [Triticum dicoccoides]
MPHRNMCWTHQGDNLESEEGQAQPENYNNGGTGSNLSNQGVQVALGAPGNTTNDGVRDSRSYYYESINNQLQHAQNLYPYGGVDPSFVYPSTMYNPGMSTPSVNRYVPHASFGQGNPPPSPSYHQVATGTRDESSSSSSFGDATRESMKTRNAVIESGHHFDHGFASSSSSAHVPQNPARGTWGASFESHGAPNGSSADGPNRSTPMAIHPALVRHGNYVFPAGHMGQGNTWTTHPANVIADGVPHWAYNNAVLNPSGQFAHGTMGMPNGSLQDYQAGPSANFHGPLPHFNQIPMHSMQTPAMLNHIQMQGPQRQSNVVQGANPSGVVQGANPSGVVQGANPAGMVQGANPAGMVQGANQAGMVQGPNPSGMVQDQVYNGSLRLLQQAAMATMSTFYDAIHLIDEQWDMGLDIDGMTYEELLALQEQIGDVNTGLPERYICQNLRVHWYVVPRAARGSDQSVEKDACIICQEEFEARDLVGALDCGHKYHEVCIRQWLMVKNLCPICKATALPAE